jgi:hypothetical protein
LPGYFDKNGELLDFLYFLQNLKKVYDNKNEIIFIFFKFMVTNKKLSLLPGFYKREIVFGHSRNVQKTGYI